MNRKISVSNWSSQEEEYSNRRNEILDEISPRDVANAPFVYSTRQSLTSALTRIDLFRKVINVQGSISLKKFTYSPWESYFIVE